MEHAQEVPEQNRQCFVKFDEISNDLTTAVELCKSNIAKENAAIAAAKACKVVQELAIKNPASYLRIWKLSLQRRYSLLNEKGFVVV